MACAALSISIGTQFMPWNLEMRDARRELDHQLRHMRLEMLINFIALIFIYPNAFYRHFIVRARGILQRRCYT